MKIFTLHTAECIMNDLADCHCNDTRRFTPEEMTEAKKSVEEERKRILVERAEFQEKKP